MFSAQDIERFSIGGREVSVRMFPASNIDDAFTAEWLDLENRAVEGNAFLSPHFVQPALKYLDPRKRILVLAIYHGGASGERLIGFGTFLARPPVVRFPLPHLEAYRSPHTFLTGMLFDRDNHWLALEALSSYLTHPKLIWCGIEFEDISATGALSRSQTEDVVAGKVRWSERWRHRRAILFPSDAAGQLAAVLTDGKFGKELRRKQRRLEELGEVSWHCWMGRELTQEHIETFLTLEHQGWKKENGSSLLSSPHHADFFREMSARFAADGRAFFTELSLSGRVIASTSNYISGSSAFAFKIGWDQELAAVSPGLLNELEFMRHSSEVLLGIDLVDSGAQEGSFVERLWRDHRQIATGVLAGGYCSAALLPALGVAHRVKQSLG